MNLFICITNLQLRIVGKLLERNEKTEAVVVFLGDMSNPKNLYTLEKYITGNCISYNYNFIMNEIKKPFKTIKRNNLANKIVSDLPSKKFDCVFLASTDFSLIHHILSKVKFKEINTFDDGAFNFLSNKKLKNLKKTRLLERVRHSIQGRSYHEFDITSQSKKHYSIFKNIENIISNVEYIDLFEIPRNSAKEKIISVLLGSVYSEISSNQDYECNLISEINVFMKENNIDYYLPHPRDLSLYFSDVNVLSTKNSAEDEVIKLLESGCSIKLYGFCSTSQLLFNSQNSIEIYTIRSNHMSKKYLDYELNICQKIFGFISINISK